jgi:histidinol phosphatase-like PHP family hydrolase
MKNFLFKYAKYFNSRKALWHVHTNYTDGECSVEDIFRIARLKNIEFICFIEHIKSSPTYSVDLLRNHIKEHSIESGILTILAFEAKLLSQGEIDVPNEEIDSAIFLAEHGHISHDKEEYISILLKGLSNPIINGWVHPGLFAKRMGWLFSDADIVSLVSVLKQNQLLYEKSKRYTLPFGKLADSLDSEAIPFFTGLDVHHTRDIWD